MFWLQDQRVSRPGPTAPPRKLHLTFRCHITSETRATLASVEYDEQPDGTAEPGIIEWVSYHKLGELPLFPLIGTAAAALPSPGAPVTSTYLPPITDQNYTWI